MKEVTKKKKWIVIFLAPGMLLFVFIFLISMVQLGITSFTDWSIGADPVFSGLANYIYLFTKDSAFGISPAWSTSIIFPKGKARSINPDSTKAR